MWKVLVQNSVINLWASENIHVLGFKSRSGMLSFCVKQVLPGIPLTCTTSLGVAHTVRDRKQESLGCSSARQLGQPPERCKELGLGLPHQDMATQTDSVLAQTENTSPQNNFCHSDCSVLIKNSYRIISSDRLKKWTWTPLILSAHVAVLKRHHTPPCSPGSLLSYRLLQLFGKYKIKLLPSNIPSLILALSHLPRLWNNCSKVPSRFITKGPVQPTDSPSLQLLSQGPPSETSDLRIHQTDLIPMAEHLPHQLHSHAAKHIKPKAKGSTPPGEQRAQMREGRILTAL